MSLGFREPTARECGARECVCVFWEGVAVQNKIFYQAKCDQLSAVGERRAGLHATHSTQCSMCVHFAAARIAYTSPQHMRAFLSWPTQARRLQTTTVY